MVNLIPEKEISVSSLLHAMDLAEILLDEEYVVMISKEEDLFIVNYIWSESDANRNDVVFMSREDYEDEKRNAR